MKTSWRGLPGELLLRIFSELDEAGLAVVAQACKEWRVLAATDFVRETLLGRECACTNRHADPKLQYLARARERLQTALPKCAAECKLWAFERSRLQSSEKHAAANLRGTHARAHPRARANLRVHTGAMASVSKLREARRAAAKPPGARPPGWHPFHVQQKIDLLPDSVCLRCAVCQRHHERTAECEEASLISSNSCRSECDMPPATCSVLHAGGAQARGWPRSSVIVAPRNIATHELRAVPEGK